MKHLLAGLVVVIVAGCSGASPSPSPTLPAALAGRTPWQTELTNLEADGTRSLESALTLFAMAFGPIPGVSASTSAAGTVGSASPAVRVVRELRDQLTNEQRAAVDGYLAEPVDAKTIEIPAVSTSRTASLPNALGIIDVAADEAPLDPFERDVKQIGVQARAAAARYFGDIPNQADGKPGVSVRISHAPGEPYMSFFNPTFGPGGFEKCDVHVNSATAGNLSLAGRSITLDMVHCFQSWRSGSEQGFDGNVPAWAWDGPAEYIMLESWPTQEDDVLYWATYLLLPDVSLFERSYDAVGYYAQAFDAGIDLSAAFVAVLTDVDNPERFALAGTTSNAFLDKWSAEHLRTARGEWGPEWEFLGPGLPNYDTKTPMQGMTVANGSLEAFSQEAYSNHLFAVHSTADIVKVEAMGRVRVGDGIVDVIVRDSAVFCTTDKGCGPCPDGSDPPIDPTQLSADFVLAVSGGTEGTNGTISGHPLEEFCKQTPRPSTDECPDPNAPPVALVDRPIALLGELEIAQGDCATPEPTRTPPPDPCDSGCPMSNGDVHIVTINDYAYDFQAVGEFVLLRSADGSFEIQGRQEPYTVSNNVSINTAIAMRADGHRIALYGDPFGTALTVMIDGAPVDISSGPLTIGSSTITKIAAKLPTVEVVLGDGTRISAFGEHAYGINLTINPGDGLGDDLVGLMGPVEPRTMGAPALPDGTVIPQYLERDAYHEQLYGPFQDAWQVTAETSLFDYDAGKTVDSYLNPNFPGVQEIVTYEDLTPEQLAAGEAACAVIQIEFLRRQCVYDVAVTGVDIFRDVYDISAEIVDSGTIKPAGQRVRIVNLYWDPTTGAQPLDVYAWTDQGAALITTVGFTEVTEWFDPGSWKHTFGRPEVMVSIQRAGDPVVEESFNLYDMRMEVEPGLERTYVIGTGDLTPDFLAPGLPTVMNLDEERLAGLPMMPAVADRGLLFLDLTGLIDTHPEALKFFVSAGDGCLTQPDFPTLAQESGVENGSWGYQGPLAVTPGDNLQLTLHAAEPGNDPFAFRCDTPTIYGPVPFSLGAGQRSHLILYAIPGDPTVRSMILPFGDEQ